MWREWVVLVSPFVLMATCRITSKLTYSEDGQKWSWVPTIAVFWGCMAAFIWIGNDFSLLGESPHLSGAASWIFFCLSLLIGLIPLPILITNWRTLATPSVTFAWLAFGLINPWFEETYWRGMLSHVGSGWTLGLVIVYSSVLFSYSHKVGFGWISPAMGDWALLGSTLIMGLIWSVGFILLHSLWIAIISHVLVDLGNLAVPVYMRLYMPPHLRSKIENSSEFHA